MKNYTLFHKIARVLGKKKAYKFTEEPDTDKLEHWHKNKPYLSMQSKSPQKEQIAKVGEKEEERIRNKHYNIQSDAKRRP